tara:strand:- start:475 stop:636 length:162 start_codon:yes stop_codon:yes gene_type:complete
MNYANEIKDMISGYDFEALVIKDLNKCENETQIKNLYDEILFTLYGNGGLKGY